MVYLLLWVMQELYHQPYDGDDDDDDAGEILSGPAAGGL